MDSELICPLCEDEYQEDNPPRLLTGCGHSYCEACLKKIMTEKKGCFKVVCPEDGEMVTLKDSSLNNFPKNIALLKIIDAKNTNVSFKDSSLEVSKIAKAEEGQQDEDDRDLVDAIVSSKNATTSDDNIQAAESNEPEIQLCRQHQKPLEVVCVIDLKKICANCAIFGEHKGHDFKSLEQIETERMDYYTSIIDIMDRKETISTRISNEETRSSIMEILDNKKEKMKKVINEKYKKLLETIEARQADSLKNLSTVIQKTEQKLKNLMNIDPQILEKYESWEQKSYNQIKILEGDDFEAKLRLLFCVGNDPVNDDVIEEGDVLLADMNKQEENLITEVETALENIGVEFNQEIFNHIDSFVQIFDEAKKKKAKRVTAVSNPPKPSSKKQQPILTPSVIKNFNDNTHYTSSLNIQEQSMTTPPASQIKQEQHAPEESLLEEEVVEKKPEFIKLEQLPISVPDLAPEKFVEKLEFSSPSAEKKVEERPTLDNKRSPAMTERSNKKDQSFEKTERPNKKKLSKLRVPEKYEKIIDGLVSDSLEVFDLTNAELGDANILIISEFLNGSKVKTVKLIRNKLNDEVVPKLLPYMSGVITLNLSQNFFTDRVLDHIISARDSMPFLKNVILCQNKIIERKHKVKIDKLRSMDLTVSV